jgi:MFS transporter, DHA2 family, multidrug resistance protein
MAIPAFDLSVGMIVAMSFSLYGTGLLNPIFLQELMGYTAWSAGLVLAPRGLGTMFSMMLVGQLARFKFDTRPLVGVGFALMAGSLWTMSKWNLSVGSWTVIWPSVSMGIGMGLVFPTLSAATLSVVSRERMGYAASLYNVMRNAGAAVGISYMTSTLVKHQQIHQSYLVEHFSVFDAWRMNNAAPRMAGGQAFSYLPQLMGGNHQGFAGVYGMIQAQASMLSFNDIYRTLSIAMFLLIPGFLLLRKNTGTTGPAAH